MLLANLLQSSSSTFSCVSFPSFFAFQESMWDAPISAPLNSLTVSGRFLGARTMPETSRGAQDHCTCTTNRVHLSAGTPGSPPSRHLGRAWRGAMAAKKKLSRDQKRALKKAKRLPPPRGARTLLPSPSLLQPLHHAGWDNYTILPRLPQTEKNVRGPVGVCRALYAAGARAGGRGETPHPGDRRLECDPLSGRRTSAALARTELYVTGGGPHGFPGTH